MATPTPPPKDSRSKEEELTGLSYLQQLYQNQYNALAQSINSALERLADLNNTRITLENMEKISGKPSLTQIGTDAYIFSTASTNQAVLVHVGAGYLAEKSIDDAKGFISKLIERDTAFVNSMVKNRSEVENALLKVSYRLDELNTEL